MLAWWYFIQVLHAPNESVQVTVSIVHFVIDLCGKFLGCFALLKFNFWVYKIATRSPLQSARSLWAVESCGPSEYSGVAERKPPSTLSIRRKGILAFVAGFSTRRNGISVLITYVVTSYSTVLFCFDISTTLTTKVTNSLTPLTHEYILCFFFTYFCQYVVWSKIFYESNLINVHQLFIEVTRILKASWLLPPMKIAC